MALNKDQLPEHPSALALKLRRIKLSIIAEAPDTLFMENSDQTICEALDEILWALGEEPEDLSDDYTQEWKRKGLKK